MHISFEKLEVMRRCNKVLEIDSFSFSQKDLTIILGRNGSGKSTLMQTTVGLLKPAAGKVLYDDVPLEQISLSKRAKYVTYLPQLIAAEIGLSVAEYVATGLTPYTNIFSAPPQGAEKKVAEVLATYNISHLQSRNYSELSGGEKQLCRLAKAHLQHTLWLILDEPNTALDFGNTLHFFNLLRQINVDGKGVIVTVHNPQLALNYGTRIILLKNKRIIADIDKNEQDFASKFGKAISKLYDNVKIVCCDGQFFVADC